MLLGADAQAPSYTKLATNDTLHFRVDWNGITLHPPS